MRRTVDAAVRALRTLRLHLQILLAIALRRQVLRRHLELLGENLGDRFRTPVRQRQVVDVGADRIGVAFDQEHLARVALDRLVETLRYSGKLLRLIRRDLKRPVSNVMRVEVDARHAVAHRGAVADFVERIAAIDALDRRRDQRVVDQLRLRVLRLDDVTLARDTHHRRRQVDKEAADTETDADSDARPRPRTERVVDDDDLAAARIAADAANRAGRRDR